MRKNLTSNKKNKEASYLGHVSQNTVDVLAGRIEDILVKQKRYKDKTYSAKKLCEELKTNTRYISVTFHRKYNMNYTSFVNRLRIIEAIEILGNPQNANMRMQEISDCIGFSNPQSFYSSFKRITKVSPKTYKETFENIGFIPQYGKPTDKIKGNTSI